MFMSKLFGTLSIDTGKTYYLWLKQTKTTKTWFLTEYTENFGDATDNVYAIIQSKITDNLLYGYGDVNILTKMLDLYMQLGSKKDVTVKTSTDSERRVITECILNKDNDKFYAKYADTQILQLNMEYEGFTVILDTTTVKYPPMKELIQLLDDRASSAVVANLGIKTATEAKMKFNIEPWYKLKEYHTVDTDEKFLDMLIKYCKYVQENEMNGQKTLTGVDTETTGLFTVKLDSNNPAKDWIVAIPFAWEDNVAYLIHVRMRYLPNVSFSLIQKYFGLLFGRNADFTGNQICVAIREQTFSFHRDSIETTGHNIMFDKQSFYSEDIDFFFDEDSLQLVFNLATDWSKGKSSLKALTRRIFNHETLELEDLFGRKHKDKFAYLQDEELARIYGCADADYSRLVLKKLRGMTNKDLYYQYKKYDICLMNLYAVAAANGMPIDTENVIKLGDKVYQDIETLQHFVFKYAYRAIKNKTNKNISEIVAAYCMTEEEFKASQEVANKIDEEQEYHFKFTPAELKRLVYKILDYPVLQVTATDGAPALDKNALKKLTSYKLDEPINRLTKDVRSCIVDPVTGESEVLIKASDFNTDRYPLARVLQQYALINKEYTAYYAPIKKNNLEGRMFKSFNTTKAATRRIINPLQTIKGALKKYFMAPKGKLFCSFDVSQMEYRLMASEAYIAVKEYLQKKYPNDWEDRLKKTPIYKIKQRMSNTENDFHTENASTMHSIKPHNVTKKIRKATKSIGFGVPYGLGVTSLCEQLFGTVTKEHIAETKRLLALFEERQKEIMDYLNNARLQAMIPCDISNEFREFLQIGDTNVSYVKNFAGFYRLFILENLTKGVTASIKRKAGNFGIQGGAAELFRRMQYNFYMNCVKAGIQDKIQWLINVHDELDFLVDDDIDILQLIEILYKSCTLVYPDHIPYYIGINFGYDWADAKDDAAELPVMFVQRLIRAYHEEDFHIPSDGNQPKELLKLKHKYQADRIYEELCRTYPSFETNHIIDLTTFDDVFTNYTVRSYIFDFAPDVDIAHNNELVLLLTNWAHERLPNEFDKVIFKIANDNYVKASSIYSSWSAQNTDFDFGDIVLSDDFLLEDLDSKEYGEDDDYFGEEAFGTEDASTDNTQSAFDSISIGYHEDELYTENFSATNYHDILQPNRYLRKYLNNLGSETYSVILSTTKWSKNPTDLITYIKNLPKGTGTIHVVWRKLLTFKNVSLDDETLDNLDKYIGGAGI